MAVQGYQIKGILIMVRIIIGTLIGMGLGAVMGHFGKCSTGTCPLTSNPFMGALFGGIIGFFLSIR